MFNEKEKKWILSKIYHYQFSISYVDFDKKYILLFGTKGEKKYVITYKEDPENEKRYKFKIVILSNKEWSHFSCASKNGTNLYVAFDQGNVYYRNG